MRRICAIAHRGFPAAAPENTLASFEMALKLKPEMLECDVHRTRDGALVIIHDDTVDRTTGGSGAVSEMTLEEVRSLDAGSYFSPRFAGERVPTLDETLRLCKGRVRLIVEIKQDGIKEQVVRTIQAHGMSGEVELSSFNEKTGIGLPELDKRITFHRIVWMGAPPSEEEAVRLVDESAAVNAGVLDIYHKALTPALVRAAHAANMLIVAWTLDDEAGIRSAAELGVDCITSNNIALLLDVLSRLGTR